MQSAHALHYLGLVIIVVYQLGDFKRLVDLVDSVVRNAAMRREILRGLTNGVDRHRPPFQKR